MSRGINTIDNSVTPETPLVIDNKSASQSVKYSGFATEEAMYDSIIKLCESHKSISLRGQTSGSHDFSPIYLITNTLKKMKPKDPMQAMLCSQMIAVNNLVIEFMGRAFKNESMSQLEVNVMNAEKLMNIFNKQVSLFNKLSGNVHQKVIVEHVHVHQGGQAILAGELHARDGGRRSKVK